MNFFFPIIVGIILVGGIGIWYVLDWSIHEDEKNTWYQNGIILERHIGALGYPYCIIQGDDNIRYSEYCDTYLVGDKVKLEMYKNRSFRIDSLIEPYTTEGQKD